MAVGDYCQREVRTIAPEETLREAARRMRDQGVGCLVVTEARKVRGIVTDRDVALAVVREGRDPDATPVAALIGREPSLIHAHMPLAVASKMMRLLCVRRLPVVDDADQLVGILAADDLLRLLARELAMVGEAVAAQSPMQAVPAPSVAEPGGPEG